ncbi:MAG: aminotransferase class I/II-fold pyridoxal phosphate-dependent enzyme [Planctomycetes bacterium]|nr:aminotransferase class I/II-fold pyridoxal phosphate-dependent enzyme [Planctomycetota bacterium]
MTRISDRAKAINPSGIRKVFDMGRTRTDLIDLSIGQPDFDVPDLIKDAVIKAVRDGCGGYSVTQGYPELVEKTRSWIGKKYPTIPAEDQLMLTSGTAGALTLAIFTLSDVGDEILLPDPYFIVYETLIKLSNAKPVFYSLYPDFHVTREEIESKITDKTRAIIINSPANPTGVCFTEDDYRIVADVARKHDVFVVSDEIYETFSYDSQHLCIKDFLPENSLIVGGFTKTFGMPGWRLGYAVGAPDVVDRMRTLQQFTFVCPPTLVQKGAMVAFDVDMSDYVSGYSKKRDIIYNGLLRAGYEVEKPGGAIFAYPKAPFGTSQEFCRAALERGLLLVPGTAMSNRDTHFRLSFATSDENLERAVKIFAELRSSNK